MDLDIEFNDVQPEVENFFQRQIPFAISQAMNDSIFDARKRIVNSTYPKAFDVRNKVFPGFAFKVTKRAKKRDLVAELSTRDGLRRDWIERQIDGGTKLPRGSNLVIPRHPNQVRTKTGRIRVRSKPRVLTDRKDHFVLKRGGRKVGIAKRERDDKVKMIYVFARQAKIRPRFRFYADGINTINRVFPGHFNRRLNTIVGKSRFTLD